MILYYIRHGDPVYSPEEKLTPLGLRQAEALGRRLSSQRFDKIYSSPLRRVRETAQPTLEMLKTEAEILDWTSESLCYKDFSIQKEDGSTCWAFFDPAYRTAFNRPEIRALGEGWTKHPDYVGTSFDTGAQRINEKTDQFMENLGFIHDRENCRYRVTEEKYHRVALFAHQGFGMAFLSSLLDIPYPFFSTHADLSHSSVSIIQFKREANGYCFPMLMQLSDLSHLYKENLPMRYNNEIDI